MMPKLLCRIKKKTQQLHQFSSVSAKWAELYSYLFWELTVLSNKQIEIPVVLQMPQYIFYTNLFLSEILKRKKNGIQNLFHDTFLLHGIVKQKRLPGAVIHVKVL